MLEIRKMGKFSVATVASGCSIYGMDLELASMNLEFMYI